MHGGIVIAKCHVYAGLMLQHTDTPDPGNAAAVTTAPATWTEIEHLFDGRGEPSRCWCRWFTLPGAAWKESGPQERRRLLQARFDDGRPEPGVLAFRDGVAVGWCAVEPRECYPRIISSRLLRLSGLGPSGEDSTAGDEANGEAKGPQESVWSVGCFVVAPGHRRSGIAAHLLRAAVEHAFRHGATVVEGYPVDPAERPKAGAADLYQGTLRLFSAAGFRVEAAPVPGRAVVRLFKDSGG